MRMAGGGFSLLDSAEGVDKIDLKRCDGMQKFPTPKGSEH